MPSRFGQIKKIGSALDHVARKVSYLNKRVARYGRLPDNAKQMILRRVGIRLIPHIREMLVQNYNAAGIKTDTGTLIKASAYNVIIEPDALGFKIQMRANINYPVKSSSAKHKTVKRNTGNVYAAAATMRYGGVRQPLIHAKGEWYVDPVDRTRGWGRKRAAGAFGAAAKRTLKKAFAKSYAKTGNSDQGAGISYVPPKPPFFTLTGAQRAELMNLQAELVRAEMNIKFGQERKNK